MEVLLLPEIATKILFFLDTKEIYKNQLVCKDWFFAMHESYMHQGAFFWKKVCHYQCIRNNGNIKKEPIFFFQDDALEREISTQQWKNLAKYLYCKFTNMNQKLETPVDNVHVDSPRDVDDEDFWGSDEEDEQLPRYIEEDTNDSKPSSAEKKFDPSQFSKDSSLVLRSVWASTVDHKSQDVNQTRYGLDGYLSSIEHTFWSSEGSKNTNSNEYCIYLLKNCDSSPVVTRHKEIFVMIIDKLKLQPFMASWQENSIYPSDRVSISIGIRSNDTKDDEQAEKCSFDLYTSEEFPVKKEYTYQSFEIGPVVLIGRTNKLPSLSEDQMRPSLNTYRFEESKKRKLEKIQRQEPQNRPEDDEERLLFHHRDILHDAFARFGNEITPELRSFVATRMKQRLSDLKKEKLLKTQTGVFQVRVNLIGKNQRQPEDDLYYTCLEFVDITGYSFEI